MAHTWGEAHAAGPAAARDAGARARLERPDGRGSAGLLVGHRLQVAAPVPRRGLRGPPRPIEPAPSLAGMRLSPRPGTGDLGPSRADARGTAPDRLGPGGSAGDRAPGAASSRCSPAARPRPCHRTVVRYDRKRPGELLHVDIKGQGRIPTGGG